MYYVYNCVRIAKDLDDMMLINKSISRWYNFFVKAKLYKLYINI